MCCRGMRKRSERVANGEWRIGMRVERAADQFLPRPARLAGSDDSFGKLLHPYPKISQGRVIRVDEPNTARCDIHSRQHRRGTWTGEYRLVHSASANCSRLTQGTRNALANLRKNRLASDIGG